MGFGLGRCTTHRPSLRGVLKFKQLLVELEAMEAEEVSLLQKLCLRVEWELRAAQVGQVVLE
ncbi:hypothetical protein D3C86_1714570 [compost metagenome]